MTAPIEHSSSRNREDLRWNRTVHHFTQCKCRFNSRDTGEGGNFLPMNAFIIFNRTRSDCNEIVIATGHQVTSQDGRASSDGFFKSRQGLVALAVQANGNKDCRSISKFSQVKVGTVPRDDATVFESPLTTGGSARRKGRRFSKLELRTPTALNESAKYFSIIPIHHAYISRVFGKGHNYSAKSFQIRRIIAENMRRKSAKSRKSIQLG